MSGTLREVIDAGDAAELRRRVQADPSLADADVAFGPNDKNVVPALHYVCDAVFCKRVDDERARAMADVLLGAGVDPNRAYAKSGDTFLIAAASLGAEQVGLRLLEAGAEIAPRGLFGATALHWAAIMGLDALAAALLDAGAELELRDERYDCTPLEWTLHGWKEGTNGRQEGLPATAAVLVGRGAAVPEGAADSCAGEEAAPMRRALLGERAH